MSIKNNELICIARRFLVFTLLLMLLASGLVLANDSTSYPIIEVNRNWEIVNCTFDGYRLGSLDFHRHFAYLEKFIYYDDKSKGRDFYLLQICDHLGKIGNIDKKNEMRYFKIIDSGYTSGSLKLCAQNAVMYFQSDSLETHLITVIADSISIKDTVLSFRNDDIDNNLTDLYCQRSAMFFLRDSLVVFKKIEDYKKNKYLFYKIGANNSCELIREVESNGRLSYCQDFTQIFIVKGKGGTTGIWSYAKIVIFDLVTETIEEIGNTDMNYGYYHPRRSKRDDYLYFIKSGESNTTEIWRIDNDSNQELVYIAATKDAKIERFTLLEEWIQIYIKVETEDGIKEVYKQIRTPK